MQMAAGYTLRNPVIGATVQAADVLRLGDNIYRRFPGGRREGDDAWDALSETLDGGRRSCALEFTRRRVREANAEAAESSKTP